MDRRGKARLIKAHSTGYKTVLTDVYMRMGVCVYGTGSVCGGHATGFLHTRIFRRSFTITTTPGCMWMRVRMRVCACVRVCVCACVCARVRIVCAHTHTYTHTPAQC